MSQFSTLNAQLPTVVQVGREFFNAKAVLTPEQAEAIDFKLHGKLSPDAALLVIDFGARDAFKPVLLSQLHVVGS